METLHFGIAELVAGLYAPAVVTFGDNLKRVRRDRKLSQEALAAKLGHERAATVLAWEKGRRTPKAGTVERLASALKCDPSDLLEGVETAYDALRGGTTPTPEYVAAPQGLTRNETRALRILHSIPVPEQHDALVVFAVVARRFRRAPSPPVDASPVAVDRKTTRPKARKSAER